MHFSILELVPLTIGAIGGVACRYAFLYIVRLNNNRQAKVLIENRAQRIVERRETRNQFIKTDEFSFADRSEEVIRG